MRKLIVNSLKNPFYFSVFFVALIFIAFITACSSKSQENSKDHANSPTEAYQKLFDAVRRNNTEDIKKLMSSATLELAKRQSQLMKQPLEKTLRYGFTATTEAQSMPETRDERIKDGYGALEVWNARDKKWDDIPFVFEDGGWKIAYGELFSNKYVKPGKGRAQIEQEAENALRPTPNFINGPLPSNTNTNSMRKSNSNSDLKIKR